MGCIPTWMAHNTLETGRKTSSTGKERRPGPTVQNTKAITSWARNTEMVPLSGQTGRPIKANSSKTTLKDTASTDGQTAVSTADSGGRIKWTAEASLDGQMGADMRDST